MEENISIEEEIYNLCDSILDSFKRVESFEGYDEKINYIGSKLNKIIRYINNGQLSFELNDVKNDVKNRLNELNNILNNIVELINSGNIENIDNDFNSVIIILKTLDEKVSSILDITLYLNRDGIKNSVQLYKRNMNSINCSLDDLKNKVTKEYQLLIDDNNSKVQNLIDKQNDFINNIDKSLLDYSNRLSGLEGKIDEKNTELNNLKNEYQNTVNSLSESLSNKVSVFENEAKQKFDYLEEDIKDKDKKISELIGIIGNKANIGEYKTNADSARKERIIWQVITLIIFICTAGSLILFSSLSSDYNAITILRYSISAILFGLSGYTGKQASNIRKDEVYYRRQQLELSSIDVYLDNLPDETKYEIKKELSLKIFGQASESYKSKLDNNKKTINYLTKIVDTLIENLPNNHSND